MDGQGRPEAEGILAQMGHVPDGREDHQSHGIEQEHGGQGHGHLMGAGTENRCRRRDGAPSADRRTDADQQTGLAVHLEIPAQQQTQAHDQGQADGRVAQTVQADAGHRAQIHLGA